MGRGSGDEAHRPLVRSAEDLRPRSGRPGPGGRRQARSGPVHRREDALLASPRDRDDRRLVRRAPARPGDVTARGVDRRLPLRARGLFAHLRPCARRHQPGLLPRRRHPRQRSGEPASSRTPHGSGPRYAVRRPEDRYRTWGPRARARDAEPARPDPRGSARHGEAGPGRDRRRRRHDRGCVRGLRVHRRGRRRDPLRIRRTRGSLRRLPPVPGCRLLRIALPRRRLSKRRPHPGRSLRPESAVQADAVR